MKKSLFNLNENIVALLSYIGTCVCGLIILILERENKFVRFHAMQSVLFGILIWIVRLVLGLFSRIPLLGFIPGIANWALGIIYFGAVIYLAYMAYKGNSFKLPIIGDVADQQTNK